MHPDATDAAVVCLGICRLCDEEIEIIRSWVLGGALVPSGFAGHDEDDDEDDHDDDLDDNDDSDDNDDHGNG